MFMVVLAAILWAILVSLYVPREYALTAMALSMSGGYLIGVLCHVY